MDFIGIDVHFFFFVKKIGIKSVTKIYHIGQSNEVVSCHWNLSHSHLLRSQSTILLNLYNLHEFKSTLNK